MNIGENIRRLREGAGMTQAELARRVGITQSMMCQIERGTKVCSLPLGVELAKEMKCSILDLITDQ